MDMCVYTHNHSNKWLPLTSFFSYVGLSSGSLMRKRSFLLPPSSVVIYYDSPSAFIDCDGRLTNFLFYFFLLEEEEGCQYLSSPLQTLEENEKKRKKRLHTTTSRERENNEK